MSRLRLKGNQSPFDKVKDFFNKYWYVVLALLVGAYLYKRKKKGPGNKEDKDETASNALAGQGIKDAAAQNVYKNITAKIADGLGTNVSWWKPIGWFEDDKGVYELVKDLSLNDFKIIKKLYFETYAKGRDLSTDLATYLDNDYYKMLKVK